MEITHLFGTTEGIGCTITIMEIKIEDESVFDLLLAHEPLDGDCNVIEVAETPAGMGTGMVSRRSDQTESGLAFKGRFCGQNGSSCREDSDFIDLRLSFTD